MTEKNSAHEARIPREYILFFFVFCLFFCGIGAEEAWFHLQPGPLEAEVILTSQQSTSRVVAVDLRTGEESPLENNLPYVAPIILSSLPNGTILLGNTVYEGSPQLDSPFFSREMKLPQDAMPIVGALSPDGQHIAYLTDHFTVNPQTQVATYSNTVRLIDTHTGKAVSKFTVDAQENNINGLRFFADSQKIAFWDYIPNPQNPTLNPQQPLDMAIIQVRDVKGEILMRHVLSPEVRPDLVLSSPDGKRLIWAANVDFVENDQHHIKHVFYSLDLTQPEGAPKEIPNVEAGDQAVFSPDGQKLYYLVSPQGVNDLFVYDFAEGKATQLTFDGKLKEYLQITQDGKNVIFATYKEDEATKDIQAAIGIYDCTSHQLSLTEIRDSHLELIDGMAVFQLK